MFLSTIPSSIRLKCSKFPDSKDECSVLSGDSNTTECCILDSDTTFPVIKERLIKFGNSKERASQTYPMEILEVTPSGHRVPLIRTVLTPVGDSHCTLKIESNANFRITITVRGYPSGDLMCTYQF